MTEPIDPDRAAKPIADWLPGDVIRLADGSIAAMMATDVLNPWVVLDTTDNGDAIFLDYDSPDLAGAVLLLRDGRPVTSDTARTEIESLRARVQPSALFDALYDAMYGAVSVSGEEREALDQLAELVAAVLAAPAARPGEETFVAISCGSFDCAARTACTAPGSQGHHQCGTCPEHNEARHHCGCLAFADAMLEANEASL